MTLNWTKLTQIQKRFLIALSKGAKTHADIERVSGLPIKPILSARVGLLKFDFMVRHQENEVWHYTLTEMGGAVARFIERRHPELAMPYDRTISPSRRRRTGGSR